MSGQESQSWDAHRGEWQAIRNALEVPALRAQRDAATPLPVRVRLEWERDGVELRETVALGWTTRAVRVKLIDRRWRINAVWVPAGDVERI